MSETELYAVWHHIDPRVLGDNFSEVSKEIIFIGSFEESYDTYKQYKRTANFAGDKSSYYGYPVKVKNGDTVGKVVIIHPAKKYPDDDDLKEGIIGPYGMDY